MHSPRARRSQEGQHHKACQRIFDENVAVPDQVEMHWADRQQHAQSAHEQDHAPCIPCKPLELDGEADAEQQGEQRKCLEVDGNCQHSVHRPVEQSRRLGIRQELREDRNAKHGHDVHR